MSLAPIWSMKPIGNVELADVPLSLLNPATQAVWGDSELISLDSQYYFGKGLIDETRPNGLLYHAEKDEASVEWLADLLSSKSIFVIGSLVFLSQQVADTLQGFDFGVGRLAKIDVFRQDAKPLSTFPFTCWSSRIKRTR